MATDLDVSTGAHLGDKVIKDPTEKLRTQGNYELSKEWYEAQAKKYVHDLNEGINEGQKQRLVVMYSCLMDWSIAYLNEFESGVWKTNMLPIWEKLAPESYQYQETHNKQNDVHFAQHHPGLVSLKAWLIKSGEPGVDISVHPFKKQYRLIYHKINPNNPNAGAQLTEFPEPKLDGRNHQTISAAYAEIIQEKKNKRKNKKAYTEYYNDYNNYGPNYDIIKDYNLDYQQQQQQQSLPYYVYNPQQLPQQSISQQPLPINQYQYGYQYGYGAVIGIPLILIGICLIGLFCICLMIFGGLFAYKQGKANSRNQYHLLSAYKKLNQKSNDDRDDESV